MSRRSHSILMAGLLGLAAAAHAQSTAPAAGASAAMPATPAATATAPERMAKDAARAEHDRIKADYKAAKEACKPMKGNEQDVCEAEAKAKEKVALAELKYKETGAARDHEKIAETKAKTDYDVAKERCEAKPMGERPACKKDAKAAEKAALDSAKKAG